MVVPGIGIGVGIVTAASTAAPVVFKGGGDGAAGQDCAGSSGGRYLIAGVVALGELIGGIAGQFSDGDALIVTQGEGFAAADHTGFLGAVLPCDGIGIGICRCGGGQTACQGKGEGKGLGGITPAAAYLLGEGCLLYTSPSPRDPKRSGMPSSA